MRRHQRVVYESKYIHLLMKNILFLELLSTPLEIVFFLLESEAQAQFESQLLHKMIMEPIFFL